MMYGKPRMVVGRGTPPLPHAKELSQRFCIFDVPPELRESKKHRLLNALFPVAHPLPCKVRYGFAIRRVENFREMESQARSKSWHSNYFETIEKRREVGALTAAQQSRKDNLDYLLELVRIHGPVKIGPLADMMKSKGIARGTLGNYLTSLIFAGKVVRGADLTYRIMGDAGQEAKWLKLQQQRKRRK